MTGIRVGIIGASGYTGGELLRLLANHPNVEVGYVSSREYAGKPVTYIHPFLRKIYGSLKFSELSIDKILSCDLVFFATPANVAVNLAPKLLESGLKVVDLSPDFRLKDPKQYEVWYNFAHPYPDLLEKAVYGMPELHRDEIKNADLIASPGCNSTASILALTPLAERKVIDLNHVVVDVKVGSSEGGRKPSLGSHHPERENAIRPYSPRGHRHVAEIEQEFSNLSNREVRVVFVPHSVGAVRGALASCHSWLIEKLSEIDLLKIYAQRYRSEPFIRIISGGLFRYPDTKNVVGSNFADVSAVLEPRVNRVTAFCAIDNLIKGAAGQAIQCMNIRTGFDEAAGLKMPPIKPA